MRSPILQVRAHPALPDTPTATGCRATLAMAVYHRHVASSMLVSPALCMRLVLTTRSAACYSALYREWV
jgi:hypothetical protein